MTEALPALLQRGAQAFAAGDYATAAAAFAQVEHDYGAEPEWQTGRLPQRLLPLRGFAELRAGQPDDAAESLAAFLEKFPDDAGQRGFVLYALALALRATGRLEEAAGRFAAYENEHAGTAQAALARFQRAEIAFARDQVDEALALLQSLGTEAPTESLRVQARLRALQKAVELNRDALARDLLFHEPWSIHTMPEIGVLAFAAMELGDRLMAAGEAAAALRAYRFVPPRQVLLDAQQARIAELQAQFDAVAPTVGAAQSFWVDFYRTRLARLTAQAEAIARAEDYTAPLRLRTGQAYLLAGRNHEAWLVFEHLALTPDVPPTLQQVAHYRWILAAAGLEAWEDALTIARDFVDRYPDAPDLPETFYLIARAHLERRRFAAAEEVFGDILARFPTHAAAGRARFTRGWVRSMQEKFAAAREDFDQYLADHPQGPLAVNAGLWRALSFFFERRHAEALVELDALAARTAGHPLYSEILYRRGTTLYALRDFGRARAEMTAFVHDFPAHPRWPEALVLLGDILMGAGDLAAAKAQFAAVPPEAAASFVYAVFQTGKILRAEEDYASMVAHFTAYAARTDLPAQPRLSEALYWVGWAEEQRGGAAAALPVYFDVLARFGNDPQAGEVGTTLAALERLVRRIQQAGASADTATDPRVAPLLARGLDAWLGDERAAALAAKRFTYYARLSVFVAELHARRRQPYQEEALLLELAATAPLAALDATALARVGLALQNIGSNDAEKYLRRLLEVFPDSFERGAAFYGLAAQAVERDASLEALGWLARFDNETPTHPLAPRAALLAGTALERAGRLDEAVARLESLLRLKAGRGRPHAEALLGLARCSLAAGRTERAVGYLQRVYTVYRAYADLVAEAYLQSAPLFEELGQPEAAAATYREMLATPNVGDAGQRDVAARALAALEARLPAPVSSNDGEPNS